MTLTDLIQRARYIAGFLSTSDIPLKREGKDVDIDFDIAGDYEHGYVINMIEL